MAIAYFITFSTYGTWLHGTARGASVDVEHNQYDTPFLPADATRELTERETMSQPPYVLDEPRRQIVLDAIVALATEKEWRLWAAHVRTNHVHVVIAAEREP